MAVTQNITLDVNQPNIFYYINTKQSDGGRRLRIRITVDGTPYNIPTGATATLRIAKPNDTFATGTGSIQSDGTCIVTLTASMLSVVGKIFADLSIVYSGTTVSSVSFIIMNREFPGDVSKITSSSTYTSLNTLVSSLSDYDARLTALRSNKAAGTGITVSLSGDIATVTKVT